jgi:hypothetical protein
VISLSVGAFSVERTKDAMAKYSFQFNDTADTTLASGGIQQDATTQRRGKLYDFLVGSEATPGDTALLWTVDRGTTALGTASAVTPSKLDEADAVALLDCAENYTVNPTLGVNLLAIPLNQRATFRWVAFPGSEIVLAATANLSLLFRTPTSSAIAITGSAFFEEQ